MTDVYLDISTQSQAMLDRIASALDARASDPAMRAITLDYLADLPKGAGRVVEIGCGAGSASEIIHAGLAPAEYLGIDPSEGLLARARARFGDAAGVTMQAGGAEATGLPAACADVVVAHTVFSHLADPAPALAEAARILRPGGQLAIFEGDYAANTVALSREDPLQCAMDMAARHLIHAPFVMRALPGLLPAAGFAPARIKGPRLCPHRRGALYPQPDRAWPRHGGGLGRDPARPRRGAEG
jgi:SAM-dependent methyltransferase